jgi:4-amino-4-deoxy-L-arabinose transferase-like glycosyltransferase
MTGQAGQLQPSGQNLLPSVRSGWGSLTAFPLAWLLLALVLLVGPFNRGGLWDPQELRIAELARRLSLQLFGSNAAHFGAEQFAQVTKSQIGQGELGVTSPALGFALFGGSDWAGRVTSLAWGAVTLSCLWMVMGRLAGRIAQVTSVLLLATLPLFAWQSRMMLGDAPTIGSLALSTSALLLAQLDRQAGVTHRSSWRRPLFFWAMAFLGLVAGVLCRGILIGVSVPTLSVGIVGMAQRRARHGSQPLAWVASVLLLGVGSVATVIGVREVLTGPAGFSFWLGATLTDASQPSSFVAALSSLLHQTFPLSAFLPVGIAVALTRSASADARGVRERKRGCGVGIHGRLLLGRVQRASDPRCCHAISSAGRPGRALGIGH